MREYKLWMADSGNLIAGGPRDLKRSFDPILEFGLGLTQSYKTNL